VSRANRVQPDGTFLPGPARGAFMGNRGCLHDGAGVIRRRHQGKLWITCTLREKPGRGATPQATPGRYTPLFFHDEAVACAAGHRPCAECRRAVYNDFRTAWARAFGAKAAAAAMDAILHAARLDPATRQAKRHQAEAADLPAGCFILWNGTAHLLRDRALWPYAPTGYGPALPRPDAQVTVLTPAPLVQVMAAGWQPLLSADQDRPNW
jgi:hypothetical protein